jgi:hypothetical protein
MDSQQKDRRIYVKILGPNTVGSREYLWAKQLSEDLVIVNNTPWFSDEVSLHDVVRVTADGEVLEVLHRSTRTCRATYEAAASKEDAEREWAAVHAYLLSFGINAESARAGLFSMTVPLDMADDRIRELCSQCPVPLTLFPLAPSEEEAGD